MRTVYKLNYCKDGVIAGDVLRETKKTFLVRAISWYGRVEETWRKSDTFDTRLDGLNALLKHFLAKLCTIENNARQLHTAIDKLMVETHDEKANAEVK